MGSDRAYALADLAAVGRQLATLPRKSRDLRLPVVTKPVETSPAMVDQSGLTEPQRRYWNDLVTAVHLRLALAEEALASVGKLLEDPEAVYAPYPLVRSVVELTSRVCWLLDGSISATVRMRRTVGDRAQSLKEIKRLHSDGAEEWASKRLRSLVQHAQGAGLQHINPPDPTPASAMAFASPEDPEGRLGRLAYQVLSAPSHGTMYGLMRFVRPVLDPSTGDMVPTELEGQYQAALTKDASDQATVALMGLLPYQEAMRRWLLWTGHELRDWQVFVMYLNSGLRQHLGADGPEGQRGRQAP